METWNSRRQGFTPFVVGCVVHIFFAVAECPNFNGDAHFYLRFFGGQRAQGSSYEIARRGKRRPRLFFIVLWGGVR